MTLIPPFFVNCVVAIGNPAESDKTSWMASGFLYGLKYGSENGVDMFHTYLITNKHVFDGRPAVTIRFNPIADEAAREFPMKLRDVDGKSIWQGHPDPAVDVAVMPFFFNQARKAGLAVNFFESTRHALTCGQMDAAGVSEGDPVFVLGFPMALVGEKRNAVVVRGGSIARIRDTLQGSSPTFWVDSFVFPGNSGGPVVTAPADVAITGTKALGFADLIGVVAGYVPYREAAVSPQTGETRIVFVENSGLATVFTVDCINEAIQAHQTRAGIAPMPVEPEPTSQTTPAAIKTA
jgi:S1-C subfamily serine protease